MPTKPLATSRGTDENIKVATAWLDDCQSNHSSCRRNHGSQKHLPTRLIEIVDDEFAQLVEPEAQVGQYVALSYCWGPDPDKNRRTTISNVQDRLQSRGLLRDDLPAAIKDAIIVSEGLGIKHIWVDAFCIIQDDQRDKHNELSKMSQYYRNSYLTIAVSTPRCTAGFIGFTGRCENHPDFPLPRDLVPLDVFCASRERDEGRSGTVYVREENPYQFSEEPINRRAWTLQESLLSPRVLFFGSRVTWFCGHMTHSDGGIEDWSFDENELERTRREFQIELSKLDRHGSSGKLTFVETAGTGSHQDIYGMWHRIVGSYSRREISYSEDKLPAISAVAVEFARLSKDQYLAGSWRTNLPRDLLWSTPSPITHRPGTWRAPTWSWASIDDAILYEKLPPKDAMLLMEIERAEAIPRSATVPFGEVERGFLEITAPCLSLKISGAKDPDKASEPWLKGFGMQGGATEREMLLDALKRSARGDLGGRGDKEEKYRLPDEVTVAILFGQRDELTQTGDKSTDQHELWTTWGLILKPVAETGDQDRDTHERVLVFSQLSMNFDRPASLFSDLRRTVRII